MQRSLFGSPFAAAAPPAAPPSAPPSPASVLSSSLTSPDLAVVARALTDIPPELLREGHVASSIGAALKCANKAKDARAQLLACKALALLANGSTLDCARVVCAVPQLIKVLKDSLTSAAARDEAIHVLANIATDCALGRDVVIVNGGITAVTNLQRVGGFGEPFDTVSAFFVRAVCTPPLPAPEIIAQLLPEIELFLSSTKKAVLNDALTALRRLSEESASFSMINGVMFNRVFTVMRTAADADVLSASIRFLSSAAARGSAAALGPTALTLISTQLSHKTNNVFDEAAGLAQTYFDSWCRGAAAEDTEGALSMNAAPTLCTLISDVDAVALYALKAAGNVLCDGGSANAELLVNGGLIAAVAAKLLPATHADVLDEAIDCLDAILLHGRPPVRVARSPRAARYVEERPPYKDALDTAGVPAKLAALVAAEDALPEATRRKASALLEHWRLETFDRYGSDSASDGDGVVPGFDDM
jgi:hypothetical protein